jgi:MFS superfamily sulfate permease-like transporter
MFFANCQRVNTRIWAAVSAAPQPVHWLIFDVAGVPDTDSAAQQALLDLKQGLEAAGVGLVFATMRETLRVDLAEAGVLTAIGMHNVYETVEAAIEDCAVRQPPVRLIGRRQARITLEDDLT